MTRHDDGRQQHYSTQRAALFEHMRGRPDAVAFRLGDEALTFGALEVRGRRYAARLLERGVRPGDRVASVLDTSLAQLVALVGHYTAGVIHVPVNTRYGEVELAHLLRDSGAVVVLVDAEGPARGIVQALRAQGALPDLQEVVVVGASAAAANGADEVAFAALEADGASLAALDALEPPGDEDIAMFIYTSGTTGPSKGVMLSYRAIVANIDALTRLWRFDEADRMVLALPLFHVHGLCIGVHGALLRGFSAELHPRFDADAVIDAFAERDASVFMGVPTMYTRLVRALDADPARAEALRHARLFTSGSAALSADLAEAFARHTGHRILERYGMSETLLTVSNPYEPARRVPGTIGFAVASGEVRVVREDGSPVAADGEETGEIVVRGDSLMHGYWNLPEKTAEAVRGGWFWTGDVASIDAEGRITHRGRRSVDILKCGGYKIGAREIEEVIARHPDVEEVAVVGAPDAEWGQRIEAVIVPVPGCQRAEAAWQAELAAFVEGKLADYKRPRAVRLIDALPRNALGKVQKHRLLSADG